MKMRRREEKVTLVRRQNENNRSIDLLRNRPLLTLHACPSLSLTQVLQLPALVLFRILSRQTPMLAVNLDKMCVRARASFHGRYMVGALSLFVVR
jgi:hypothetical protein